MTKVNLGRDTSNRPLVVDDTTLAKVRWAEAQLGWTFTIIQGSYMKGIGSSRSGGTHDAGGAVDLRTWDIPKTLSMTRVLTVLRQAGLIAWHRWQSAFPDHEIHAIDYGNPGLSTAARAQVIAWLDGRNGLGGSLSGRDDGPKVTIPKNVPDSPPEPPVTERRAVDYSFSRPSLATVKKGGYEGIGRYIGGSQGKRLTTAEANAARALGLFVWLVWEETANRAAQGRAAGVADCKAAEAQARLLGYPKGSVIFYAVDFDANPAQVKAYFDGVKATAQDYLVGDYGGIKITDAGLTDYHWQTAAWSGGKLSQKAHLYQRVKPNGPLPAGCDENVICRDFPAWTASSTPTPKPTDPTTPPEDDMPYKDWPQADKDALLNDLATAKVFDHKQRDGSHNKISLTQAVNYGVLRDQQLSTAVATVTALVQGLAGVGPDVAAIRAQVEKDAPSA